MSHGSFLSRLVPWGMVLLLIHNTFALGMPLLPQGKRTRSRHAVEQNKFENLLYAMTTKRLKFVGADYHYPFDFVGG